MKYLAQIEEMEKILSYIHSKLDPDVPRDEEVANPTVLGALEHVIYTLLGFELPVECDTVETIVSDDEILNLIDLHFLMAYRHLIIREKLKRLRVANKSGLVIISTSEGV